MTRFKVLLAGAAASAALVLGSAGGAAAVYPPSPSATIDVEATVGDSAEGATIAIAAADGFCPVPGTWTFILNPGNIPLLAGGATPSGAISLSAPLPALAAGTYTATFSCNPSLTATFTIAADGTFASITDSGGTTGGGGGGLPSTGSDATSTTLQIGAIALAAGLGMLGLAAIRRRSSATAAA